MAQYLLWMLAICGTALAFRHGGMSRAALVIMGNWAAVYGFNAAFGTFCPWVWWITIDALSALVVLRSPASKWQILIGVLYIVMTAGDAAYGALQALHGFPDKPLLRHSYWEVQLYASCLQLINLFTWGAWHGGRRAYHHMRGGSAVVSDHSRRPPVARKR
jgi:hypothetical protein